MDDNNLDELMWFGDSCTKKIIIKMDENLNEDSLQLLNEHNTQIKKFKKNGNQIFFGDENNLKMIDDFDGDKKIIMRNLGKEGAKGEAIFITDDAEIVKEMIDENGEKKVVQYTIKKRDDAKSNVEVFVNVEKEVNNGNTNLSKNISISPANANDINTATEKGILKIGAEALKIKDIDLDIEDEQVNLGTTFAVKGKLDFKIFDQDMNQVWEKIDGKVNGVWSVEIPQNVLNNPGNYFILFNLDKKSKMFQLSIK